MTSPTQNDQPSNYARSVLVRVEPGADYLGLDALLLDYRTGLNSSFHAQTFDARSNDVA